MGVGDVKESGDQLWPVTFIAELARVVGKFLLFSKVSERFFCNLLSSDPRQLFVNLALQHHRSSNKRAIDSSKYCYVNTCPICMVESAMKERKFAQKNVGAFIILARNPPDLFSSVHTYSTYTS